MYIEFVLNWCADSVEIKSKEKSREWVKIQLELQKGAHFVHINFDTL